MTTTHKFRPKKFIGIDPGRDLGTCRNGRFHISLSASFAEQVCDSFSGGVNELEIGMACTSTKAGESLKQKIYDALGNSGRDVSLWLTDEEAMCLAVASQNCQTESLSGPQRARIDAWFSEWLHSDHTKEQNNDLFS